MTGTGTRNPSLPERLAARAFALATDPTLAPEAAGAVLLRMARGRTAALGHALRRVEPMVGSRRVALSEAAATALRAALTAAQVDGRADVVAMPASTA